MPAGAILDREPSPQLWDGAPQGQRHLR